MSDRIADVVERHLGTTFPGAIVLVANNGQVVYNRRFGHRVLHPHPEPMTGETVFDLASLSKPLGTTLVGLTLLERKGIPLSSALGDYLEGLPEPTARLTLEQLLTHTGGLPAVPLLQRFFPDPGRVDRDTARSHLLRIEPETTPGTEVIYSCTGFQLLGEALGVVGGAPLDALHRTLVAEPLGLTATRYSPPREWKERCAGTEYCPWRETWVRGEVHDESAYALEGVAGNAGLFSTAAEVLAMAEIYRNRGAARLADGTEYRLFSPELAQRAATSHTDGKAQRRGLGLQVNAPDAAGGPDTSPDSFGHTGFTGTSFWIDPTRDMTVVTLTNRLQYGRNETADAIKRFRRELHSAAVRDY